MYKNGSQLPLITIDNVLKSPPTSERPYLLEEPSSGTLTPSLNTSTIPPEAEKRVKPTTTGSESMPLVTPTLAMPTVVPPHSRVKLPELTLKKFGGD